MDKISICNASLGMVGGNLIASFDVGTGQRGTKELELCRLHYAPSIRYVLADRPWSFATKRIKLNISDPDDAYGEYNRYKLPTDHLIVQNVSDNPSIRSGVDNSNDVWYMVEDGYVISDHNAAVHVKYTRDIQETSKFSPAFEQATIMYLGYKLGMAMGLPRTKTGDFLAQYNAFKTIGFTADSMQGRSQQIRSNGLVNQRAGSGLFRGI